MRTFVKGEPFMDVPCGFYFTMEDGEKYGPETPVFSEAFLYHHVGKDNARFILAVAEEYTAIIQTLGTEKVKELLEKAKAEGNKNKGG